jgi:transcriptional regulator of arginine metabolism
LAKKIFKLRKSQEKEASLGGKKHRQHMIIQLIQDHGIGSQQDLVQHLAARGVRCTQASVSRDITELGLIKIDGVYRVSEIRSSQPTLVEGLTAEKAGDNLVVLRTGPGVAQAAALMIDRSKIPGLVGTVAGDDTIFLAVRSKEDQQSVIRFVFNLFQRS